MPLPSRVDEIDTTSARVRVFTVLRDWIEDGTLAPGEALRDREIAERLGVSRTPVREALQMLEHLGAVETEARRHTRVTAVERADAAHLATTLAALHGAAAEGAARRADATAVARLRELNDAISVAVAASDPVGAQRADEAFHAAIVELAANPFLAPALEPLELHARRLDALYLTHVASSLRTHARHLAVIEAIERGHPGDARRAMRANWLD